MCGICGALAFSGGFDASAPVVERMADTLRHRGPDDAGVWADGPVGLGHRRLSIVDLSPNGRGPMCNEDGTVWITFNGEIYNHAELRRRLEPRGHAYRSRTDTETILHLYEEEGRDCVRRLHGMFAFAIWDARAGRLLLARDRLGIKPLYFRRSAAGLVFGSEVKALLAHPSASAALDLESFHHFLTFGCVPAPGTLFEGVEKLGPAETMEVGADGAVRRETYWTPFSETAAREVAAMSPADMEGRFLELLREAVRKRLMSDVQFGVFLSGGIDSSTNVALMAELMDEPVRTYSVGFSDTSLESELPHAERVARHFGTDHHSIVLEERHLLEALPELAHHQDEPVADWVSLPLYHLAALAKGDGTTVVQVGEGADELLHGYDAYARAVRWDTRYGAVLDRLPEPVGAGLARAAEQLSRQLGRGLGPAAFVSEAARGRLPFWGGHVAFREFQKAHLVTGRAARGVDSHRVVEQLWREGDGADRLQRMTYLELRQRLSELLLMRVDKMTMASSVEARVPFLDHELVEFAMALPPEMKVGPLGGKHILKRAVRDLLPPGIADRRKQGFSAPVSWWFRGPGGRRIREQLAGSSLRRTGLLDWREVDRLWDAHTAGRGDWGVQLWTLYTASMWHDAWIGDGAS